MDASWMSSWLSPIASSRRPLLVVLRGVFGCGKTTAARCVLAARGGGVKLSADDYFELRDIPFNPALVVDARDAFEVSLARALLAQEHTIVIDGPTTTLVELARIERALDTARASGARHTLFALDFALPTAAELVVCSRRARIEQGGLSWDAAVRQYARFELNPRGGIVPLFFSGAELEIVRGARGSPEVLAAESARAGVNSGRGGGGDIPATARAGSNAERGGGGSAPAHDENPQLPLTRAASISVDIARHVHFVAFFLEPSSRDALLAAAPPLPLDNDGRNTFAEHVTLFHVSRGPAAMAVVLDALRPFIGASARLAVNTFVSAPAAVAAPVCWSTDTVRALIATAGVGGAGAAGGASDAQAALARALAGVSEPHGIGGNTHAHITVYTARNAEPRVSNSVLARPDFVFPTRRSITLDVVLGVAMSAPDGRRVFVTNWQDLLARAV